MKWILFFLVFIVTFYESYAYDAIKRYSLMEDRLKLEEFLRPIGHDFFLDINAAASNNIQGLISDASDLSKKGTEEQKIDEANYLLTKKYDSTEFNGRVGVGLGFPLPSFKIGSVGISPDFHLGLNAGVMAAIRTIPFSVKDIPTLLPVGGEGGVTPEIKAAAVNFFNTYGENLSALEGQDIAKILRDEGKISEADYAKLQGKYLVPKKIPEELKAAQKLPVISAYTKVDVKVGPRVELFLEDYFGHVSLYYFMRTDFYKTISATDLARDKKLLAGGFHLNTQTFVLSDLSAGRKWGPLTALAAIEEIGLMRLKENVAVAGDLNYKITPLYRLHGSYEFQWTIFKAVPFAGIQMRSGRSFSDSYYLGARGGVYFFKERIMLQLMGMMDSQYITFAPKVRLWPIYIEAAIKSPLKSTHDDMKVVSQVSVNFRLAF